MERFLGHDIDPSLQEALEVLDEGRPIQETRFRDSSDQKVEVASRGSLGSADRPEHSDVPESVPLGRAEDRPTPRKRHVRDPKTLPHSNRSQHRHVPEPRLAARADGGPPCAGRSPDIGAPVTSVEPAGQVGHVDRSHAIKVNRLTSTNAGQLGRGPFATPWRRLRRGQGRRSFGAPNAR